MKITLQKKKAMASARPARMAKAGDTPAAFVLIDNEDDTCTVFGVDGAGERVDISQVATLAVTSSDPAIVSVDPPTGMTFQMHAKGPVGSCNITAVATWADGSKGPFTVTLPVSTVAGGPVGIMIVPGTPTAH